MTAPDHSPRLSRNQSRLLNREEETQKQALKLAQTVLLKEDELDPESLEAKLRGAASRRLTEMGWEQEPSEEEESSEEAATDLVAELDELLPEARVVTIAQIVDALR